MQTTSFLHQWAFWTNLFFLIPLYIALVNKSWMHAFFICLTMAFSFLYHFHDGQFFEVEDRMTAIALIAVNAVLLMIGLSRHNHQWWLAAVTVFCQFFFLNL
jgi:hypothetical protein